MDIKEKVVNAIIELKEFNVEYLEYVSSGIDMIIKNKIAKIQYQQLEIQVDKENKIRIFLPKPLESVIINSRKHKLFLFYADDSQLEIRLSEQIYKALISLLPEIDISRLYE